MVIGLIMQGRVGRQDLFFESGEPRSPGQVGLSPDSLLRHPGVLLGQAILQVCQTVLELALLVEESLPPTGLGLSKLLTLVLNLDEPVA